MLAPHVRYRWDAVRQQHQLVFPEGVLVLNAPAVAIVRLCDGRPVAEVIDALRAQFEESDPAEDVGTFLGRLAQKGLVRDAGDA
jgi:coenzyme PQQ biosynthesis protein PqqD